MKSFNYHQTTKILFGRGRIQELLDVVKAYGTKAMLVTTKASGPSRLAQYQRVISLLESGGVHVVHYDGVIPNPTVEVIDIGGKIAKEEGVEVVIGLGGGSSMDTAKAIAIMATHPGSSWDYLFYKNQQPDPKKILPIVAVSTTSGTGSQVTQVAVVTNTEKRDKSAIFNNVIYPLVAIIDPELMLTIPKKVTAPTGFDVFCHAFESAINVDTSPYVELLSWEAIRIVISTLPKLLNDLGNIELREKMAYADTLAGLCIANAGVTLPHGMGMAISGMYPQIAHGVSLAIVYPAFVEFTWHTSVEKFAKLSRMLNPVYDKKSDMEAASHSKEEIVKFLETIGLDKTLSGEGMPQNEIEALGKQCLVLPDYKANPRIATDQEMLNLVKACFK